MKLLFKTYFDRIPDDYNKLWKEALFIFDANIMLDIYRLPEAAKEDFFLILNDPLVSSRIWLPFQAVLEFLENRLGVISEQKNKFGNVERILKNTKSDIDSILVKMISEIEKLNLRKRHAVIDPEKIMDDNLFNDAISKLDHLLENISALSSTHPDVNDRDDIPERIFEIFKDKVGTSFSQSELNQIYKEGEERYKNKIPPGYEDATKDGTYAFEDKRIEKKFGDLILWKEIIQKAINENLKYIIFISNDNKGDWMEKRSGKIIGPKFELLNEIYFRAPKLDFFHIYDIYGFMRYSKENLSIEINEQSMNEAKDLITYENNFNQNIALPRLTDIITEMCNELMITPAFYRKDFSTIALRIPINDINNILVEILTNVEKYSKDKIAHCAHSFGDDYLYINFFNDSYETSYYNPGSEKGLARLRMLMEKYGVLNVTTTEDKFTITLIINRNFVHKF